MLYVYDSLIFLVAFFNTGFWILNPDTYKNRPADPSVIGLARSTNGTYYAPPILITVIALHYAGVHYVAFRIGGRRGGVKYGS